MRTPDEQVRENQQPAIIVSGQLAEEEAGLSSVVADIRTWMQRPPLPVGYRWELGGHYVKQQEAFQGLALIMLVAVMLVLIMLSIQFQSVVLPLLIFMTQPLSLVSGLFALWITHAPLNVSSYMGAILLIGLDMKNGILLVEYIQQLRAEGMPLRPALQLAGRTRFRPILMTSLAAILGLFPLALGIGPGSQMQQPLAIMVIGGLTANMLFYSATARGVVSRKVIESRPTRSSLSSTTAWCELTGTSWLPCSSSWKSKNSSRTRPVRRRHGKRSSRAELKAVDAYRNQFAIKTPIAGQLGMMQVTPGQSAGTAAPNMVNLDEINVLCYVPPHAIGRLVLGQPAHLDAQQPPTGEVVFIAAQAEAETGDFAVKVRFQNLGSAGRRPSCGPTASNASKF